MQDFEKPDIFDLLDAFELVYTEKINPEDEDVVKILSDENVSSYLQKEDKILSIAKEKMRKLTNTLKTSDLEKKLYAISYNINDGLWEILQKMSKVIRKYIKDLEIYPEKIVSIKNLIEIPVEIEIVDQGAVVQGVYKKLTKGNKHKLLRMTAREDGYPDMVIYGALQNSHTANYWNVLFYDIDYAVADMGALLSYLILLKKINATIRNQRELVEDRCKNIVSENERWSMFQVLFHNSKIKMNEFMKHPVFEMEQTDFLLEERLVQYFPDAEFYYERKHRKNAFYLNKEMIQGIICNFFPYEYGIRYPTGYHFLLEKGKTGMYWPLPIKNKPSRYTQFIAEIWKKISEIQDSLGRQISSYKDSQTQYAKSYQTKKNIPQRIVSAMENSVLNRYFGYVEYDESVDLSKVREIEKEFVAFKETYFPSINSTDNSIRFRRLGKQKAAGLYYPACQCLCVDINNPSSLIHEFGHLIDYTYDNLSLQKEFMSIISLYSDEIHQIMLTDENMKKRMNSNTKYNLHYYTMPTEVFARCYELYCKNELGISNSLIKASGNAYPDSEELNAKIREYFDTLFKKEGRTA